MNYWSSQNHSQLKCPICRRMINLLHIDYDTQFDSQEYFKTNNESSIVNITHEIYHYNYLYGNKERSVIFLFCSIHNNLSIVLSDNGGNSFLLDQNIFLHFYKRWF